jgi:glutamyl-tRNA reductase
VSTELRQLHVRFATFRDHAVDERTAIAERFAGLPATERVLIETCHRVELVSVEASPSADVDGVRGLAAVRRVFEVVAGFDSAVIAEEQLIGQVRAAHDAALASASSGPILNELLRRAIRFGRRVRTHARPGADRSLADPALRWLRDRLPATGGRVVVAGTGEIGRLVATRLAADGHHITVVSRDARRAAALRAELVGSRHRSVGGTIGRELSAGADALVLAVRGSAPAITDDALPAMLPWVVDFAAPPSVTADAAARLGERLLALDTLAADADGRAVLAPETEARLRRELAEEVAAFAAWLDERRGADALAVLHREADRVRRRHLDRLRDRADLDERQLAAVEATSAAMVGELLHGPSVAIRRSGTDAAVVRRLFGIEAAQ